MDNAENHRGVHNLVARQQKTDFPMIGKDFSNGWKKRAEFSNDWKTFVRFPMIGKYFPRCREGRKGSGRVCFSHKDHNGAGLAEGEREGIYKNEEKTASRTRTRSVEELKG